MWLHRIGDVSRSGLLGGSWSLDCNYTARGVRRVVAAGDAPKNEAPQEIAQEKQIVTLERMLELSRPHVTESSWSDWEQTLRKEYKQ